MPAAARLLDGLLADASLFPPAALPVGEALAAHRALAERPAWYRAAVASFLVGVPHVTDVLAVLDSCDEGGSPDPLRVGLVARPGTAPEDLAAALGQLRARADVVVVSIDEAWRPGWAAAEAAGAEIAQVSRRLEVPRERQAMAAAVADVAAHPGTLAKYRTGATAQWPWPTEAELACFLATTTAARVPFVLTGGLHHVVRGEHAITGGGAAPGQHEDQHGLLDVLLAVHDALGGADEAALAARLAGREVRPLRDAVAALTGDEADAIREAFVGYGCCDVDDPLSELSALSLVPGAS